MDNIKFRAFYKRESFPNDLNDIEEWEKPQMIYNVHKLYDGSGVDNNSKLGGYNCFNSVLEDGNFIITQFTRLHDKNKKEIYEGDITACGKLIIFTNGMFIPCYGYGKEEIIEDVGSDWWSKIEITGNIYENKNLTENE